MTIEEIQKRLIQYNEEEKKLCITSSFQTHSLPLLHMVTNTIKKIPVLFIDTGFHFPETYQFRNQIASDWSLNLINVQSKTTKNQQMDTEGNFLYADCPEYCCFLNKVEPLNEEVEKYDIWIAGLRHDQTSFRSKLNDEEALENGVIKFHPILDWNSKMIYDYAQEHHLPTHPLEQKGYLSIGCMPCTTSIADDMERNGRWYGSKKTECGIHLAK